MIAPLRRQIEQLHRRPSVITSLEKRKPTAAWGRRRAGKRRVEIEDLHRHSCGRTDERSPTADGCTPSPITHDEGQAEQNRRRYRQREASGDFTLGLQPYGIAADRTDSGRIALIGLMYTEIGIFGSTEILEL